MDGYIVIGTELDTSMVDKQIGLLEDKLNGLVEEYEILEKAQPFEGQEQQLIKLGGEIDTTRKKLSKLVNEKEKLGKTDLSSIKNSIQGVGQSVEKVTKKVGKWALAIFGIRSAYSLVRNAMSTLSQYDDKMAVNVEYIRYLLASVLKPVIEGIINLAYKLLIYINYIAQAWFGVNLFANASTKAFEKQNKALGGTVKQAKQLEKTLSGFDEMNILQKNGEVSSGGGGGGAEMPSLPAIEETEPPKWLQFIVKHKKPILATLGGIAGFLTAIKLGFKGLKSLGIGVAIAGIIYALENVIDFIKDPSFKNFIGILEGIAVAVGGVAIAFTAWPVALGAALALIVIEIVKYFDKIKKLFQKAMDWLDTNFLGGLRTLFGPIGDILYLPIKYFAEKSKATFETFFGGIKKVIEGVIKLFKGEFWEGIKQIFSGLLDIMTAPLQGFVSAVKGVWGQIKESVNYWSEKIGGIFTIIKNYLIEPIDNFVSRIKNLWNEIKDAITSLANKIKEKIKNAFSFSTTITFGSFGEGSGSGGGSRAKGGIYYPSRLPKLGVGGIINNPGAGVPYHGATIGERGAEAVVPLTDSQQMALLGEAIGKYITINANIVNTMNGRVISRELQKVQTDSDFAYNR